MSLKNFIFSKLFLKQIGIAIAIVFGGLILLLLWLNIYTRHGQATSVPDFYGLTMEETVDLAKKSKMRFTIVDSVYTSAVNKGCIVEQNPKAGYKVKKHRNILLVINALRPEMVSVPDLIDLPLRQAIALIENSGLILGELVYKPDLSIDIVLQQQHKGKGVHPGDSLQKGSIIDLVLGKGLSNQRTNIPDLTGYSLDKARDRILKTSLNLGTFIYDNTILTSQDSINAFVYKQNPEYSEDGTLQLGSPVYLWLTVDSMKLPVDSTAIAMREVRKN